MSYYPIRESASIEACATVRESIRSVFVGPIAIDEWFASPFPGTIGTPHGDGLQLEAGPTAPRFIGTALTVEEARWEPGTRFEHAIDLTALSDMDRLTMTWYPRWLCSPWDIGWFNLVLEEVAIPGIPPVVEVTPDFSQIGVPRVPMRMMLGGRIVGEPTLGSGAAFRLFNPCTSLTWCYVLNDLDQLVLALKCDSPFDVEASGRRYTVDSIELDPMQGAGAVEGMDRVEISGTRARQMAIVDAGFVGGSSCRADCDGDGNLTIFDFLCYQNLFASGDLAADFDGDRRLTIFDFLAFQNEFDAGCE